jgi:hypothetical protein
MVFHLFLRNTTSPRWSPTKPGNDVARAGVKYTYPPCSGCWGKNVVVNGTLVIVAIWTAYLPETGLCQF